MKHTPITDMLDYQIAVNRLLLDVPRPAGQLAVLSTAEVDAMRVAFLSGETPLSFVSRILFERRVAAHQVAA